MLPPQLVIRLLYVFTKAHAKGAVRSALRSAIGVGLFVSVVCFFAFREELLELFALYESKIRIRRFQRN